MNHILITSAAHVRMNNVTCNNVLPSDKTNTKNEALCDLGILKSRGFFCPHFIFSYVHVLITAHDLNPFFIPSYVQTWEYSKNKSCSCCVCGTGRAEEAGL